MPSVRSHPTNIMLTHLDFKTQAPSSSSRTLRLCLFEFNVTATMPSLFPNGWRIIRKSHGSPTLVFPHTARTNVPNNSFVPTPLVEYLASVSKVMMLLEAPSLISFVLQVTLRT